MKRTTLLITAGGVLYLTSAAIVVWAVMYVFGPTHYAPLEFKSPQHVTTPTIHVGEPVGVDAIKCNHSDTAVPLTGSTNIRNLANGDIIIYKESAGVLSPGCSTQHFDNKLTPDPSNHLTEPLPPGRYHLFGTSLTTASDGTPQRVGYVTEPFTVIP